MITYISKKGMQDFAAFDLETTGFGASARITEIGAVKVHCGEIVERFDTLVNPGMPIPPGITALTGITNAMVADAPCIHEALPVFFDFTEGLPLVAHNARFDCGFIQREMERQNLEREFCVADTLSLARKTWKLPCYKLGFLTDYFCIAQEEAHRAWCDAEATAKLYMMME